MPRFAAIDVGSNALRLRIIEAGAPHHPLGGQQLELLPNGPTRERGWTEIVAERASVRLGSDVFVSGRLSPGLIGQACAALRQFRGVMDNANVDVYRAVATSAVREAKNRATLAERARREAGIELEVIEGIEEARLIQLAVRRKIPTSATSALLVDVGGGSTELTLLDKGEHVLSTSLPIGTVRLLDTYLRNSKAANGARLRLLDEAIDRSLAPSLAALIGKKIDVIIGTGGNVETLADLCPRKELTPGYGRVIDVAAMQSLRKRLSAMTTAERRDTFNLRPDRADTIVPAAAIFDHLATALAHPAICAPGVGLTAGILEELVDKFFHVWDTEGEAEAVIASCLRLGRRYAFDEAHGRRVSKFAAQLFDDLRAVHAFGDRERLLLRAAALIHDIGDYVRYDAHHKHSYYLIQHSDIMGLSRDERAIVANIARYHRKGPPETAHPNFRDLDKEGRGKVRGLAAIVRIADALDREHLGKVTTVRATVERAKGRAVLSLDGASDRELEEWTVLAKSELLRDVYDLRVELAGSDAPRDSQRGEVHE
jgi:exopolyphosphatase/guanosine-5'-triphosphate,3'-diphosphate pyrophosphatase